MKHNYRMYLSRLDIRPVCHCLGTRIDQATCFTVAVVSIICNVEEIHYTFLYCVRGGLVYCN